MAQGKRQNIFRGLLGSPYLGLITVDKNGLITGLTKKAIYYYEAEGLVSHMLTTVAMNSQPV